MISDFIEHALKATPKKEKDTRSQSPKSSSTQDCSFEKIKDTDDLLEGLLASFNHKILILPKSNPPEIEDIKKIFHPENYFQPILPIFVVRQGFYYYGQQIKEDFQIIEENILNDERTTLMVKNVPKTMTPQDLKNRLNKEFKDQYDFIYMPFDNQTQTNLGYAFVNFLSPLMVQRFYQKHNGIKWTHNNQEKICQLRYAKLQGRRDLINQLNNQQQK